jgi:Transposase, Mutator family
MSCGSRLFFLLVPLLTALEPAAAHAAESGDFAGLVDIGGGRKMYLECRGAGSPTVVFVSGLKASAEDWNIAERQAPTVFAEVAKFTRVCAYDRPGTPVGEKPSRSDPVRQPTTAQDGHRHGHRERQLMGTFGPVTVRVPRARLETSDSKTVEWKNATIPAYQRRTKQADALIAGAYLAGTNTRRVRRAAAVMKIESSAPEAKRLLRVGSTGSRRILRRCRPQA